MKSKEIRQKLAEGEVTYGTWMQIPHPAVAEILSASGFEWVAIDLEHGQVSPGLLPDLFRAIELSGACPFARVARNHPKDIKQALDAGAKGIIVPMVETKEDANNMIIWSQYPPDGKRGVGFSRANVFGLNFPEYSNLINKEIVMVAQIEHINAVKNLKDILSTGRLDAIMIGPYDLSGSMGLTGKFEHPDFLKVISTILAETKRQNVACGFHIIHPNEDSIGKVVSDGYRFIALGTDAVYLWSSATDTMQKAKKK
ncbi:2,4-dihydroxyhept-2-ene-1,7-dioic acid aldolase [Leptospira perolatii]|uniref:2,4-dihydroxyhept-2-ene-1,7-dioic acid aldolase n=1 Tax=Leptospira perolatii TaxID=2023191 RepID=A0A2M9ZL50_9LEPT|nr:aldolase/citrate lyase family protein [Leptospira perolatii]PJZ70304.1 2,4-dihydroxyhept-2-ene-1,7-dioic acid aldolase [Leptospira perolatii]PJZ72812.1 2,4-dihydroxyhept-2-ene-1,7-dioic acid aldolase [Leptospira perolatii]